MNEAAAVSHRDWLPNRTHAIILCLIAFVGLLRGTYWIVTTEVWNPIDEAQHYSYVESLARGHGMPIVGKDKISLDVMGVAKSSPTLPFQSQLYIVSRDFDWGAFGNSYEGGGVQGPLYYALLAPVYWVSHPFGNTAAIYALRFASIAITLASVPLLWLLAKRLFSGEPIIWLAAPALLVLIQGFNANSASINNDSLLIPISIAAMIPVADAVRGLNIRQAAIAGALFGLALLTKPTATPLGVYSLLVLVWLLFNRRETIPAILKWGVVYGAVGAAVLVPYIVWNFAEYGAYSASSQVNDITGPIQDYLPATFHSLKVHGRNALTGFWDLQPRSLSIHSDYFKVLQWSTMLSVVFGFFVAVARRQTAVAATIAWLALAFPVAFGMKLATNYLLVDGVGSVFGRHVYPALGLVALSVPAGLVVAFGRRAGVVAIVIVFSLAMISERQLTDHYITDTYTISGLDPQLGPVVDQPVNEGHTRVQEVDFDAPCPVHHVGIVFTNSPPPTLSIVTATSAQQAIYLANFNTVVALYALPQPISGEFKADVNADIAYSESVDNPFISAPRGKGDPVASLYCAVDDPRGFRFKQVYDPGHPNISYSLLRAWPTVWYWIGWAFLAASMAGAGFFGYGYLRKRKLG